MKVVGVISEKNENFHFFSYANYPYFFKVDRKQNKKNNKKGDRKYLQGDSR